MIFEKTKDAIIDIMGIPENEVLLESHLYDELDADSLDISQIIIALENAYKIDIDNDEIASFQTVEDIVKHVEGKLS
ncbi:acyl carrier protein [Wukongibacter sp. M2B1]|uniref:acyl carrier protein n=1 Tax=Wukongibacter sp. M2B1 TaxID=3088895 RepID=UPI003D7BA4D2